jgi:hypothetical protein
MGRAHRIADWIESRWNDVRLPPDKVPVFPRRCVGCGGAPGETVRVASRGKSSLRVITGSLAERLRLLREPAFSVEVPVCVVCAPRVRWQQRWRRRAYWSPLYLGVAAHVVGRFAEVEILLWGIPAALCVTAVWVAYETFHPEVLSLTETDTDVRYEFRSRDVARAFAEANGTKVE